MWTSTQYRRLVRGSAWYDLLMPWSAVPVREVGAGLLAKGPARSTLMPTLPRLPQRHRRVQPGAPRIP